MGRDNRRIVARRDAGRVDNTANATFRLAYGVKVLEAWEVMRRTLLLEGSR
jgi:hypothetical protein